jgi:hypothetical protein
MERPPGLGPGELEDKVMIRAHGGPFCRTALVGRRVAPRVAAREQPVVAVLSPDRLAVDVVRHLNAGDLDGFRTVVAPTVRLQAAGTSTTVSAKQLFTRLSTLAPRQTLCAARVRGDASAARVDLEVAWPVASGDVAESSLGTLELECAAGRVTGLVLDLDVDPAVARAAAALRARPFRRAAAL